MLNPSPEVIEFPAVLYDAKNRTVPDDPLSVFHGYVMPTEEPILSKFCTELTGINQDQVNSGSLWLLLKYYKFGYILEFLFGNNHSPLM